MDGSSDYDSVFREMLQNKICLSNCMLYEKYALLLEAKCRLIDAFMVYHLGISRFAFLQGFLALKIGTFTYVYASILMRSGLIWLQKC